MKLSGEIESTANEILEARSYLFAISFSTLRN